MKFRLRPVPVLGLGTTVVALTLSACADAPTTQRSLASPMRSVTRSNAAGFGNFEPLATQASCATPPATLGGFATYQPFTLPDGYSQAILATEVTDFAPLAGSGANNLDMMTLNETGPQAGRYMYRTHEVGSNGAVTVTDLWTGTTSLVVQRSHFEALDGIAWTPWGTVIFAEERIIASLKDPAVPNAVGGLVYEYDPATGGTVPRPAVGARSHEGLRFDTHGNLYGISESTPGVNGSGAIYRFVPDTKGDLSSGQLYALKVLDPSRTGDAIWVPLDRQAVQVNSDAAAIAAGATGWGRPEDIEMGTSTANNPSGPNVMYIPSTSEDLVLKIALMGDRASVTNYVKNGVNVAGLDNPDNVALDSQGNLYIQEDNGPGDIWVARPGHGTSEVPSEVVRFASLTDCSAEPTGVYFDRTGTIMYTHVQHAGGALGNDLFVAITRDKPGR
ncbi:MAG TPA: alkaline phosphatase PhoX [Gemmatimonadaceae bacterium]|jgi:hypothetical protein|nr:alkaline phosphatase PhoX [Gemmatimonadaceae bacterium]